MDSGKTDVTTHKDGVGADAVLIKPEYLYQHKEGQRILFIDRRSCLRQINLITNNVTTILGEIRDLL